MRFFSKVISFIFNPIFIPLVGTLIYFRVSPKYNPQETARLITLAILILTVVIPLIFYLLLKNLGWVTNNQMTHVKERKIPLYICIILTYITLIKVTPVSFSEELYFFFVGILGTLLSCLVMVYFKFKASMHMMGICGLATFILGLSVHFEINLTFGLALIFLCIGAVASARLYLKSHTATEVIMGAIIGIFPQFILFNYWL